MLLKYIAIEKTMNIIMRSMQSSPSRCARNLMELGNKVGRSTAADQKKLYGDFLSLCEQSDKNAVKQLFYHYYMES